MSAEAIWQVFQAEYLDRETPLKLNSVHTSSAAGEKDALDVNVYVDGELRTLARRRATARSRRSSTRSTSSVHELRRPGARLRRARAVVGWRRHRRGVRRVRSCGDDIFWGVGLDPNIVTASLKAVISAVNRAAS